MNTLKWMKDYPGNKFYPYTHTDAVLVGNDEENLRNLTDELNQINIQSVTEHLSNTQSHIPDGGDIGQVVGMTDGGIGWIIPQPSDNTPTKISQLENDCNYISESVLANALAEKIDKAEGMGLSSNDYSSDQKEKLLHIEDGANKYVHPETHPASMIAEDETHRFVTSEEKALIGTNISSNGSADIKYLYIPINRCVNASQTQITSESSYTLAKDAGIYIGITISKEHYEILKDYIIFDISMHSFSSLAGTAYPYNDRGYVYKIGNYQNVNIGSLERHYLRQVHVYNPSPSHTCSIHGFYCSFIKADFEELKE